MSWAKTWKMAAGDPRRYRPLISQVGAFALSGCRCPHCRCLCSIFCSALVDTASGPATVSVSPQALFRRFSSRRQSRLHAVTAAASGSSISKMTAQVGGGAATPAATFSSSLGVKLRGNTGRSIDAWLQKHKKNQASVDNSQTNQGYTPRGQPLPPL